MVTCKSTVRLKVVTPALLSILQGLVEVDRRPLPGQPRELTITSINDSDHVEGSKHYTNEAVDLRSRTFEPGSVEPFRIYLEATLGSSFRVIFERDHFHVQVKRSATAPRSQVA